MERASAQESAQRAPAGSLSISLAWNVSLSGAGLRGISSRETLGRPKTPAVCGHRLASPPAVGERSSGGRSGGPGWGSVGVGDASAPVSEPGVGGGAKRTADRPSRPSPARAPGVGVLEGPFEGGWARPSWEASRGRQSQLLAKWDSRPVTGTPPGRPQGAPRRGRPQSAGGSKKRPSPQPRPPPAGREPGGSAGAGLRGGGGLPGQGRRQGRPRDHMGGGRSWSPGRALPRVGQTAAAAAAGAAVSPHLPSFPSLPGPAAQPDE